MRFSMLYSGEQILSFKPCLVFYAGDSLIVWTKSNDTSTILSTSAVNPASTVQKWLSTEDSWFPKGRVSSHRNDIDNCRQIVFNFGWSPWGPWAPLANLSKQLLDSIYKDYDFRPCNTVFNVCWLSWKGSRLARLTASFACMVTNWLPRQHR